MCLGIPGRIVSIEGEDLQRTGRVDFGGIVKAVNLAYVPEAEVEDHVIVHVGFAISVIDEEEATLIFQDLERLGRLQEELDAVR